MRRNVEKCAFVRNGHGNIGKMEAPHHRPHGRTPTTATTYVASASCHESFLPRNVNVDRSLRKTLGNARLYGTVTEILEKWRLHTIGLTVVPQRPLRPMLPPPPAMNHFYRGMSMWTVPYEKRWEMRVCTERSRKYWKNGGSTP